MSLLFKKKRLPRQLCDRQLSNIRNVHPRVFSICIISYRGANNIHRLNKLETLIESPNFHYSNAQVHELIANTLEDWIEVASAHA